MPQKGEKAYKILVFFYADSGQEEVSINRQVEYEGLDHQLCFTTTGIVPEPIPQRFDEMIIQWVEKIYLARKKSVPVPIN